MGPKVDRSRRKAGSQAQAKKQQKSQHLWLNLNPENKRENSFFKSHPVTGIWEKIKVLPSLQDTQGQTKTNGIITAPVNQKPLQGFAEGHLWPNDTS